MSSADRATPLVNEHRRLGARMTVFAGWDMPLQYVGVIAEHRSVREDCGVFDVTHLGKLSVSGPRAVEALQHALTADVEALEPGRATYSLVLTDEAGAVDDIFVYRLGADDYLVVPNAANVKAVAHRIADSGGKPVDAWQRYAILAVQGPRSSEVLERAFPGSGAPELKLHRFKSIDVAGHEGLVARTGYTGERGFELYAPWPVAVDAWRQLITSGAAPVGLGARDTLRLEMGYALYGHELALDINPLEAGLGWAVAWETDFRGREALADVRERGPARRLFGIVANERGVPRQGYAVFAGQREIGRVTSGNYSPSLGTGIALALGPADLRPEVGEGVAIEARGRRLSGDIVKPPFLIRK